MHIKQSMPSDSEVDSDDEYSNGSLRKLKEETATTRTMQVTVKRGGWEVWKELLKILSRLIAGQ